jgi:vacuolar protein sorting-associated protein 13A/C
LGRFTLLFSWKNLTDKPLELVIEDVYLVAVPSPQSDVIIRVLPVHIL